MKKLVIAACIATLCVASLAYAQDEISQTNALGLGWNQCGTTAANAIGAQNVNFACGA